MPDPARIVVALDHSYAAGRDQHIHLHAIPCAECAVHSVVDPDKLCKRRTNDQKSEAIRALLFAFGVTWVATLGVAVYASTWMGLDANYAFPTASAAGFWCVWRLSQRVRAAANTKPSGETK